MKIDIKYLLLILILSVSCNTKRENLLLSEDKLRKIVFDIHTAEYIINRTPVDLKDSLNEIYINQIMEIHEVKKEDFYHDIKILQKDPSRLQKFYEQLQEESEELIKDEREKLEKYKI